ncbi:hypothetical protein TNCV_2604131 [Trichonephila clavipes]|nr:hypothetical protein TNCV_2604131 [Trichonephila clavipes]
MGREFDTPALGLLAMNTLILSLSQVMRIIIRLADHSGQLPHLANKRNLSPDRYDGGHQWYLESNQRFDSSNTGREFSTMNIRMWRHV